MTGAITFLLSGVVLGLSAGLAPGPLLTLVVSETFRHGTKEGIKVSMAPLLTDLPIVLFTLFILSPLSNIQPVLGAIFLLGSAFLVYLGYESISFKGVDLDLEHAKPQSLKKGVVANFLNPHPYMFWLSIGAPMVLKALSIGVSSAVLFISGFYTLLIGSKLSVALVIGKSRSFLKTKTYVYTIKALGIILLVFAALFLADGLKTLGVF
ncbi:MAG: LysE family translocator [bacterium]